MTSHIKDVKRLPHHVKREICGSRACYREGRKATAVKVYTINQESCYLLITNVNAVGAAEDLKDACLEYGDIADYHAVDGYETEPFTEAYLVKFVRIQSARIAKKKLDERSFFGAVLHVCYAPEFETVDETRGKIEDRLRYVAYKTGQPFTPSRRGKNRKRPGGPLNRNPSDQSYLNSDVLAATTVSYIWSGQPYTTPVAPTPYVNHTQPPLPGQLDPLHNDEPLSFCSPHKETDTATTVPDTIDQDASSKKQTSQELASEAYERTIALIRDKVKGVAVPNADVLLRKRKL